MPLQPRSDRLILPGAIVKWIRCPVWIGVALGTWCVAAGDVSKSAPAARSAVDFAKNDARDWWSLQVLKRPPFPQVTTFNRRSGNPIDVFIAAKLEEQGLKPFPEAERRRSEERRVGKECRS